MTTENREGYGRPAGNCMTHGENLPCYECTVNAALDEAACEHERMPAAGRCPDCGMESVLCRACSEAGGADMPIYHGAPACRDRGVAGDRCEVGNECGRIGCPECQQ